MLEERDTGLKNDNVELIKGSLLQVRTSLHNDGTSGRYLGAWGSLCDNLREMSYTTKQRRTSMRTTTRR
jgi:hypothetical protein